MPKFSKKKRHKSVSAAWGPHTVANEYIHCESCGRRMKQKTSCRWIRFEGHPFKAFVCRTCFSDKTGHIELLDRVLDRKEVLIMNGPWFDNGRGV